MNLSREDLIILTASILYAACPAVTSAPRAVDKALEIEGEVKRQRREQECRNLPADFREHLPSALEYAKERLAAAQQKCKEEELNLVHDTFPYPEK